MPIYRETLVDFYVQIPNALARSKDLSPQALGMLVYMLSMAPDFNPTKKEMRSRVVKIKPKPFDTAYEELQESGYVYCDQRLNKQGKFDYQWHVSSEPWPKEEFLKRIQGAGSSQQPDPSRGDKISPRRTRARNKDNDAELARLRDSLSEDMREDVESIFKHWNQDDFTKHKKWARHTKLSKSIIEAFIENLDTHSCEDITGAISNYADVLLSDDCYWSHPWRLVQFLTVTHDDTDDKKWHQFLPSQFDREKYLDQKFRSDKEKEVPDKHPQVTQNLIICFGQWINNRDYKPSDGHLNHFRLAANRMMEFFAKRNETEQRMMDCLSRCLRDKYKRDDRMVIPSHLSSDHTWNVLMPQYCGPSRRPKKSDPKPRYADQEKIKQAYKERLTIIAELAPRLYTEYRRHHNSNLPEWEEDGPWDKKTHCVNAVIKMIPFYELNKFRAPVPQESWISDLLTCLENKHGQGFESRWLSRKPTWRRDLPEFYEHSMEQTEKWKCPRSDQIKAQSEEECKAFFEKRKKASVNTAPTGDTDPAVKTTTENGATIQGEDSAGRHPESLSEDTRKDVQEKEIVENETADQPKDSVETLLGSLPKDKRKDVQDILEIWNEIDDSGHEQWTSQRTPSTEMVTTVIENLKAHECYDIAAAIVNYSKALLSDEHDCSESVGIIEFLTATDSDGNKKWHQYLDDRFSLENLSIRDGLCQASYVPPSEDKTEAPVKEADPDSLPVTQHQGATEDKDETSEAEATTPPDNSVETLPEFLPEEARESRKETSGVNTPIQSEDSADTPPESQPEDERKDVQEEVEKNENESVEVAMADDIGDSVERLLGSLSEDERKDVQEIWGYWNDENHTKCEQWISQPTLSTKVINAILENLKTHICDDIGAAIFNYAKVRLSDEFDYQDSKDLLGFLTTTDTDGNKKWWHQFLEEQFTSDDYRKVGQSSGSPAT